MVRRGRISQQELDDASKLVRSGRRLGDALVELEIVAREEVELFVRAQLTEIASRMLNEPPRKLEFRDEAEPGKFDPYSRSDRGCNHRSLPHRIGERQRRETASRPDNGARPRAGSVRGARIVEPSVPGSIRAIALRRAERRTRNLRPEPAVGRGYCSDPAGIRARRDRRDEGFRERWARARRDGATMGACAPSSRSLSSPPLSLLRAPPTIGRSGEGRIGTGSRVRPAFCGSGPRGGLLWCGG